jgi:diacylglycerol kinase family enzyme
VVIDSETPFPVQVDGDSLGDHRRLEVDLAPEALWVVA